MSEIVRFEMSGRVFEFDPEARPSLLDLDALAEARVDPVPAGQMLADVVAGRREADVEAVRAIGALAYLAAVRAGSRESWRDFARAMDPQTLRILPDQPAAVTSPAPSEDVLAERVIKLLEERKTAS